MHARRSSTVIASASEAIQTISSSCSSFRSDAQAASPEQNLSSADSSRRELYIATLHDKRSQHVRHSGAILDFQRKRGESSAAFFVPFLNEAMDVLDVGCGPGTITTALAKVTRRATGIDINIHAIEAACRMASGTPNASFVTGTMTRLPFDNGHFDAVFFHAVLYHLDAT